jgi:hypothetical protein
MMLSAGRTVAAMLMAPVGTMAAHLALSAAIGDDTLRDYPFVVLLVGTVAAVAGLVVVLPVLIFAPALRLLPLWAAAAWGAALALFVTVILVGPLMISRTSTISMAVLGSASGLTYAIAARVLMRRQQAYARRDRGEAVGTPRPRSSGADHSTRHREKPLGTSGV